MKDKYKAISSEGGGLICDNPECDYDTGDVINFKDLKKHIGRECPKCGDNLLTESDYNHHKKFNTILNIINVLYFPFLFLIGGRKEKHTESVLYHHHDGDTTLLRERKNGKSV